MKVADYIVDFLIDHGVTDAFGIPGGVILDLLYAMDARKGELEPHLSYHEQAAAFAAMGYAQVGGKLGVAYATRGPGITNMVTPIADAYYDSIPLMVFTAHVAVSSKPEQMRIELDQELNTIPLLKEITKYAVRIETADEVAVKLQYAYDQAMSGRKGPVVLDFLSSLFSKELCMADNTGYEAAPVQGNQDEVSQALDDIQTSIQKSHRPVILIGDGIKQSGVTGAFLQFVNRAHIPVISSRAAHDILADSPMYYGFVGSHGVRYANLILSKADLIISIGNRISFPIQSASFRPIFEKTHTIRIDIDEGEFARAIPNSRCFMLDLKDLVPRLENLHVEYDKRNEWIAVCDNIRTKLWEVDQEPHIEELKKHFLSCQDIFTITCDVGNHEFWVSHALVYARLARPVLYSKSFGALGCSIPKAIGAYYATRKPVLCVTGDQGFQMNIQELQFIATHHLPIRVLIINNRASGMIRSREIESGKDHLVHTTKESGYCALDVKKIAYAYRMPYKKLTENVNQENTLPVLYEFIVDECIGLHPFLPRGNRIYDLIPKINVDIFSELDILKDGG